ncbi:hypothetical protein HMPREF9446_02963 [Bacteroides fluxus YIT 12057]|uniref:Uncharacterized protein n=1 Tax=Bacteroides fluxus YIT 12057 TaxID=763034 RepID=F3PW32_9BACE|nr:hypothetical protein HMPREF9446_02963 [Bacteroides fluxus YIT 12057]
MVCQHASGHEFPLLLKHKSLFINLFRVFIRPHSKYTVITFINADFKRYSTMAIGISPVFHSKPRSSFGYASLLKPPDI